MRIALATVGTTGDVRPFLVLASALLQAGHEVRAVTWPVHVEAFRDAGIPVEAAGPHADPTAITATAQAAAERGPMEQVAVLRDFHLVDGAAHLGRLRELLAGFDLVVLHGIHALAHAAVLDLGVPFATAVFDPVLLPTRASPPPGMPNLGPANRLAWRSLDRMLAGTARPLDAILAEAGSRQRGLPLFRAVSPRLHLVACSPSIMAVPPDLPPTTHVTGAWLPTGAPGPLPDEVDAFLAGGPAPVVITFGSMGGTATGAVDDAVARLLAAGCRVVVQGGSTGTSPGVLAVGGLDHRSLFPRAVTVVHHGGAGTTHTAVAAGVPSVVVPQVGDQRYWADRLARLGVAPGPVAWHGLTGERLAAAALTASSEPAMRARAGSLAASLGRERGAATAATLLTGITTGPARDARAGGAPPAP